MIPSLARLFVGSSLEKFALTLGRQAACKRSLGVAPELNGKGQLLAAFLAGDR